MFEFATDYERDTLLNMLDEINALYDLYMHISEYEGRLTLQCLQNPVDCYFAFEHLTVGMAIIDLAIAGTAASCAAAAETGQAWFCYFARVTFAPVLGAGCGVVGVGIIELGGLGKDHKPSAVLGPPDV